MAEEVGGFFASLRLMTDEASFRRGTEGIKNIASGLKGLIAFGAGLAGLGLTIKGMIDSTRAVSNTFLEARRLDMTTESLQAWSAAMGIASADAMSFQSALTGLWTKMERLNAFGEDPGEGFWKAIAFLNINPSDFRRWSTDQQARSIFKGAEGSTDQKRAKQSIVDLLGENALKFYTAYRARGLNVNQALSEGAGTQFTTGADAAKAFTAITEFNKTGELLGSIFKKFSVTVLNDLQPYLKKFNSWITDNKTEIDGFIKSAGALAAAFASSAFEIFAESIAILSGNTEQAKRMAAKAVPNVGILGSENKGFWQNIAEGFTVWGKLAGLGKESKVKIVVEAKPNTKATLYSDSDFRASAQFAAMKYPQ